MKTVFALFFLFISSAYGDNSCDTLAEAPDVEITRESKVFRSSVRCVIGYCRGSRSVSSRAAQDGYSNCEEIHSKSGATPVSGRTTWFYRCYKNVSRKLSRREKRAIRCEKLINCYGQGSVGHDRYAALYDSGLFRCNSFR